MKALEEAIAAKQKITKDLEKALVDFSETTGLRVCSGSITPIETTNLSSKYPEYGQYNVILEVDIP